MRLPRCRQLVGISCLSQVQVRSDHNSEKEGSLIEFDWETNAIKVTGSPELLNVGPAA